MRFVNKVAIITGAGRNVGEGISAALVAEGALVAMVDNNQDRLNSAVDRVLKAGSGTAKPFVCDVSSSEDVQRMVAEVVESFGRIDYLVNNVAVTDRGVTVLDLPEEEWDRVLNVTLRSVFLCTKYAGRQMVQQGEGGAIVNIGSTSGYHARGNATAYSAAKAGTLHVTKSIALQLGPHSNREQRTLHPAMPGPSTFLYSTDRKTQSIDIATVAPPSTKRSIPVMNEA